VERALFSTIVMCNRCFRLISHGKYWKAVCLIFYHGTFKLNLMSSSIVIRRFVGTDSRVLALVSELAGRL